MKPEISYEDFDKIDFRVATITEAEDLPKSKKLLKLTLDLGFEKRTVVSGIKNHYKPEDLIGKKCIAVANLKPAKLGGIESQGMILAAGDEETVTVVILNEGKPGMVVS